MKSSVRDAFSNLFSITIVPFYIIKADGSEHLAFSEDISGLYKKDFLLSLIHMLQSSPYAKGVFLYQLHDYYYCGITALDQTYYCVTAPTSSVNAIHNAMPSQIVHFLNPDRILDFSSLVPHIPVMGLDHLDKMLCLARTLYGASPSEGTFIQHRKEEFPTETLANPKKEEPTVQIAPAHHSLYYDERMSNTIMRGDVDRFVQEFKRPMVGYIGVMSMNQLQQAKYSFVCAIFSMSRAAIKGGLPTEYALQLSDECCQRMDQLKSIDSINQLLLTTGIDFCQKVQQFTARKGYSPYTKQVLNYIRTHLFEPLSAKMLSREIGLNIRSLANYFKEDMGMNIMDYITQLRLEEAKRLLLSTDLPINQISEYLCFSSQSYFGKKYKKYWGCTPQHHRNMSSA